MIWLLDDQHLSERLRTGRRPRGARGRDSLYTTGYWYVRLCQAVFGSSARPGVLSDAFTRLPPAERSRAVEVLVELPEDIGLMSLRELAPLIGNLRRHHDLNVLSSEALAASVRLGAHVLLSAPSPKLENALAIEHRQFTVRDPRAG